MGAESTIMQVRAIVILIDTYLLWRHTHYHRTADYSGALNLDRVLGLRLHQHLTSLLLLVVENSAKASHYINADTLTMLGDLSNVHKALAFSLESYANTIEQVAPLTQTPLLADATGSMLQLIKDIGVMSDRIMEMTDDIFVMADNIGLMADNIVETQNIQTTNVQLTETSLLTSQSIMINVIKNFGL